MKLNFNFKKINFSGNLIILLIILLICICILLFQNYYTKITTIETKTSSEENLLPKIDMQTYDKLRKK